jgi:hypothetical protein
VISVLATAPKHQSGKFVFQTFFDGTGVDGVGWSHRASSAYVAVIGSIMAQYGLTGRSKHASRRLKDVHVFCHRPFRFRRGRVYGRRDSQCGHRRTDRHRPVHWRLCDPRLVLDLGLALLNSRFRKDSRVADGSTSDADLLGHGRREWRDRVDGECPPREKIGNYAHRSWQVILIVGMFFGG